MIHQTVVFAQQQTVQMDSMYWIMLASRILHILGAIILVGGLFYIRFVVSPVDVPPGTGPVDQLFGGRRVTWAKWVGIATALLLITGFWNYIQITQQQQPKHPSYHALAGIKILAAFAVFLLAALLAGRTTVAEALRQKWRLWLTVCLILGLITVLLGSVMRSYPHNPKLDTTTTQQIAQPTTPPAR